MKIPVWEQLTTDQADPWQVAPTYVFTTYDCVLISVAFVVLCPVGCLGVTGVVYGISDESVKASAIIQYAQYK